MTETVDLVERGTELTRHRRELFDLVGSAAADTQTIDLELVGETIEKLPQAGKRNGFTDAVPVGVEA